MVYEWNTQTHTAAYHPHLGTRLLTASLSLLEERLVLNSRAALADRRSISGLLIRHRGSEGHRPEENYAQQIAWLSYRSPPYHAYILACVHGQKWPIQNRKADCRSLLWNVSLSYVLWTGRHNRSQIRRFWSQFGYMRKRGENSDSLIQTKAAVIAFCVCMLVWPSPS